MIDSKTLFVVGAGASNELTLPTGRELADAIAHRLDIKLDNDDSLIDGDRIIYMALQEHMRGEDGGNGDSL